MKKFGTRSLFVAMAVVAGLCGLIYPAVRAAQNAAMKMQCMNHVKQIGLAFWNYESVYRRLPMAIETSKEGKLWRSWRSHLYPTFMEQAPQLYDVSQAWDSKTNLRLLDGSPITTAAGKGGGSITRSVDRIPWCFKCPACTSPTGVNYVVITGEGTVFPESASTKFSDITDGLENTLLLVESINCTPDWTEPRDLHVKTMDFKVNSEIKPSISSFHTDGANVCFADLGVFFMTTRITEPELRALITIQGGENVKRQDLVARGVLIQQ